MSLSPRVCILIHNRRSHRSCLSKLINWHRTTWYILCSSTLPLRTINRSSIRNHRRVRSVIPTIHRANYKPKVIKSPIRCNIHRSKHNIFPTTLPRPSRNTTTILRLSWCLHHMKYHFINRVNNLIRKSNNIPIHYMRKNCIKPTNPIPNTHKKLSRMTTKLPTSRTQLLRTTYHFNN